MDKSNHLSFLLFSFLALSLSAFAAAPAAPETTEVLHGTGLRWGMSPAEVEQALHAHIQHGTPHSFDEYSMKDVNFDGLPALYIFGFTGASQLSSVSITIKRPSKSDAEQRFDGLKSRFLEWYGHPVASDDATEQNTYGIWVTARDKIAFEYAKSTIDGLMTILITVERRVQPEDAVTVASSALAELKAEDSLKVRWAGIPVIIIKRSQDEITKLKSRQSDLANIDQPNRGRLVLLMSYGRPLSLDEPFVHSVYRSTRPELGIYLDVSTESGCTLLYRELSAQSDVQGTGMGFLDPCHGHSWDSAGWPLDVGGALSALLIPKYHFETNGDLVIGR